MMKLKKIRNEKGYTQQEMAEFLQCSQTVYSRYESGEREPSIDILLRLSVILDVSVDYLLDNNYYLSDYEWELVFASRAADERAKEDALDTLRRHATPKEEKRA